MKIARTCIVAASVLLGAAALAPVAHAQIQPSPVVQNPPFDRLAKLGPDGKIVRIEGILDILAIPRNTLIDSSTREKLGPLVQAWMADVDQLVIDNLDFLESIEPPDGKPGVIEKVNLNDLVTVNHVAKMMTQLMSAGPLTDHLERKEGLTREQAQRNQEIVNDYLQQVMNEIMAAAGAPNDLSRPPLNEKQKVDQMNAVSRFLYYMTCRDAIDSYHRQLADAAPHMSSIVGQLNLPAADKDKVKARLDACASVKNYQDKRNATRALLDLMTFDQRREALAKARELVGPVDPLAGLPPQGSFPPPQPTAIQPVAPAGAGIKPGGS